MQLELEFAEEWLPVIGFEGWYEVSNFGRVRSVPRSITYSNGRVRQQSGILLGQRLDRYGYLTVSLKRNQRGRPYTVHSLMARAFIGPPPPGHTVDHKNGKKLDNIIGNLEYVTPAEQIHRAMAIGIAHVNPHGEKNTMAKLTDVEVTEIRRLYLEGMTQTVLAKQFGVNNSQISRIVNRKRRRFNTEGQETS